MKDYKMTDSKERLIRSVIEETGDSDPNKVASVLCLKLEDLYGDNMEQQLGRLDMRTYSDVLGTVKQYIFKKKYCADV